MQYQIGDHIEVVLGFGVEPEQFGEQVDHQYEHLYACPAGNERQDEDIKHFDHLLTMCQIIVDQLHQCNLHVSFAF